MGGCEHLVEYRATHGLRGYRAVEKCLHIISPPGGRAGLNAGDDVPACVTCGKTIGHVGTRRLYVCLVCATVACWAAPESAHARLHAGATPGHAIHVDLQRAELFCCVCNDQVYDPDFDAMVLLALAATRGTSPRNIQCSENKKRRRTRVTVVEYRPWAPGAREKVLLVRGSIPLGEGEALPWGLRGLNNLGNTCFMNCILQALLHTSPLRNYFLSDRHNRNVCGRKGQGQGQQSACLACDMDDIFSAAFSGDRKPYSPAQFLYRLLNGNSLSGSLPEQIGYLPNLDRIQIDENNISGSLPKSFANLIKAKHFHMNNNSISGEIPMEFSNLSGLVHLLLDSNNLSGKLPPELSEMPNLRILQLDNNHFTGYNIPSLYTKMERLLKLSLRNCSLQGSVPDFSSIPELGYLDLSHNNLTGKIPSAKLSANITTIDLSYNNLNGIIPSSFADLPQLQKLLLDNNELNGSVPAIGLDVQFGSNATLLLDFQNNKLTDISDFSILTNPSITMWLNGNPLCSQENQNQIAKSCATQNGTEDTGRDANNSICSPNACPPYYEYNPKNPDADCYCVAPFEVGFRLKSPGLSYFPPYHLIFEEYLTSGLKLKSYQLSIINYIWEPGPRLAMNLKFFPLANETTREFNASEIQRIREMFAGWRIPDNDIFGPHEWINITLEGPYANVNLESGGGFSLSKGALAGVLVGTILGTIAISFVVIIVIMKRRTKHSTSRKRLLAARKRVKIAGVKDFDFTEMALATNNFSISMQVGQGGYGRVYKGILADGTIVAIKRAQEDSLQGEKEFSTEIDLLSRVHHLNLVSLVGYCDDEGEQMLVYEYMANGTVKEHLSESSKRPLNFSQRIRIALGAARGILYLHNEANPPIFHRDIKASNILLDHRFNARVADFGLSKLAPLPDLEGSAPGHVSTVVKGTPGYLDPEYFLTHKLTDKSDVYSFGVVLLELLTGMQPISHGKNIVREVNMAYESGMMLSMIDPRMGSYPSECLEPFASLALRCCKDETDARPSMAEVVHALEKILQFTSGVDTKSMQSVEMDALLKREPFTSKTSSQNPYVSSNLLGVGSDLISRTVPDIAPR